MPSLMVATPGGHLAELRALAPRLRGLDEEFVWLTTRTPQTESMLAGERVIWVPGIEPRAVGAVLAATVRAPEILRRLEISTVVSTGSGIALAYLPVAAAMGLGCHYIEAATRLTEPSMTGRLLQRIPRVATYTQYESARTDRWHFEGSVFDGFRSADRPEPIDEIRRAVVTVGTMSEPFTRLLDRLLEILPVGTDVLWQTGNTPVDRLGIPARAFVPSDELDEAIGKADAVIGHCGCGTAMGAMALGAHPVLAPRLHEQGEVLDDHQHVLADYLSAREIASVVDADRLTYDDLLTAANRVIVRDEEPPEFHLLNTGR